MLVLSTRLMSLRSIAVLLSLSPGICVLGSSLVVNKLEAECSLARVVMVGGTVMWQ